MNKSYRKLQREREKWIENISIDGKEVLLLELEMILRAFYVFFNVNNHPYPVYENPAGRDFTNEMRIVKTGMERAIRIVKSLLKNEEANILYFQSYVENKLLRDYTRDRFITETIEQRTPKDALFFLTLNILSLLELSKALDGRNECPYSTFHHFGQITSRLISVNKYFDPFKLPAFSPLFDKITNKRILKTVKNIKDNTVRRVISVTFLAFLRFLKYLSFANAETKDEPILKANLLIFTLLKSEMREISAYIEKEIPSILDMRKKEQREIADFLAGIKFQNEIENKKVYQQVLKDFSSIKNISLLRGIVDTSRGVLTNNFQQIVVALVKHFDPSVEGKDIFIDFVSKLEQSLRLREDLWIYKEVLQYVEDQLEGRFKNDLKKNPVQLVDILKDYIVYFHNLSFTLLRYTDLEHFEEFARRIMTLSTEEELDIRTLAELKKEIHTFRIFVETTLSQVNNRAELKDMPFNRESAKELLEQFIA